MAAALRALFALSGMVLKVLRRESSVPRMDLSRSFEGGARREGSTEVAAVPLVGRCTTDSTGATVSLPVAIIACPPTV